jgi:hypothetical protein
MQLYLLLLLHMPDIHRNVIFNCFVCICVFFFFLIIYMNIHLFFLIFLAKGLFINIIAFFIIHTSKDEEKVSFFFFFINNCMCIYTSVFFFLKKKKTSEIARTRSDDDLKCWDRGENEGLLVCYILLFIFFFFLHR